MTTVLLTSGSTSPWSKPSDWVDVGHTVNLVGCGGRGGVAVTGASSRSGSGGGGGGHVLNTYSSGALSSTTAFFVNVDYAGSVGNDAATAWGSGTISVTNSYYVQGGTQGVSGSTGGLGGVTTTTLNGTPPTPVYTQSQKNAGGNGGATAAVIAGAGGGGGAAGPLGAGAAGGASTTASRGGGGGGGSNGGAVGAVASGIGGAAGGNGIGGTGGGAGAPGNGTGTAGTAGTGGGGGAGAHQTIGGATVTGGAGGNRSDFAATVAGTTGGSGAGGAGAGDNTAASGTPTASGGAGASYGGGGGGAGGTNVATGTRNPGAGASGLIAINYGAIYSTQGTYLTYASRTNSTLVAPAGIANGDLLIAYIFAGSNSGSTPTITPPAGWTALTGSPILNNDGGTFFGTYNIYYKIASGEAGDYAFTNSTASTCGLVIRYIGVDTSTPFSPTPTNNKGTGTTATATGFTTTVNNTFVVFTEHDWADNVIDTVPPTGTTPAFVERVDQTTLYVADGTLGTAGATGNKSHTNNSIAGNPWGAYLIGLNPATAAGPVSANVTGVAATGAANTATVSGKAPVTSFTGVAATGQPGGITVGIGAGVFANISGVATTGNPGNLNGLPLLDENGFEILDENGAVILDGDGGVTVTTGGAVSVSANVSGVAATGAVNTATVAAKANVSTITGVAATGAVNTATVAAKANVTTITGVAATGAVNTATVAAKANVTTISGVAASGLPGGVVVTITPKVSFGSQGTYLAFGTPGTSFSTLAAPSGIANGNLLIAYFYAAWNNSITPPVTPPAGWSVVPGSPLANDDASTYSGYNVFYKIASGESGDYQFDHSPLASTCGVIIRYVEADTSSPLSPLATTNKGIGTTATGTGFTTTVPNTFVIFTEHDWGNNTTNTTPPIGTTPTFTERVDQTLIYVADGTLAAPGVTGDKSHTNNSNSSSPWGAYLIGLQPVGGGAASVNIPSATATGAVNTPTIVGKGYVTLTGAAATGAVTTPTVSVNASASISGVAAAGLPGDVTVSTTAAVSVSANVSGVAATGAVNTPTVTAAGNVSANASGVAATGAVNTVTTVAKASTNVSGVAATGQVGTLAVSAGGSISASPPEAIATGAVNTLTVAGKAVVTFTGVAATGAIGTATSAIAANVNVAGVAATGIVNAGLPLLDESGLPILDESGLPILDGDGITVVITAGTGSVSVPLTGVAATGQTGLLLVAIDGVIVPSGRQRDADPDYWRLPWFQVEGESFTDRLRSKTITALDKAFAAAEDDEPAKAKRSARKAAKDLREYAKAAGALLSDDAVDQLSRLAQALNYSASQWQRAELIERVSNARMALLAYEAMQQDEEDALIALMVA